MADITGLLPFIIPLALIELALAVVALVHVIRHPKYKFGNMAVWIIVVVFIGIIGPVVYFIFGKGDE
jgi:uncharacterized membrane protein